MIVSALANEGPSTPCYFTRIQLSGARISKKRKPYSVIGSHSHLHTVHVISPKELSLPACSYGRVTMRLLDIVERRPTGSMVSDGRPLVDNRFILDRGKLRLELDKPTYERCGLVGKPIEHAGRKHLKQRFAIEVDLNEPSMVPGKKGYQRVVKAFSQVLVEPVQWLTDVGDVNCSPSVFATDAIVPSWDASDTDAQEDVLEWLGLVLIDSPRIASSDKVDPYICRYQTPQSQSERPQRVVHSQYHGFLTDVFVMELLKTIKTDWFAISAQSFEDKAYTILFHGDQALVWEMA